MADLFEATSSLCHKPKKVSNWLMVETLRLVKERGLEAEDVNFSPAHLAELIDLVEQGLINGTVAKEVFEHIFDEDVSPREYVEKKGLKSVNDTAALEEIAKVVVAKNPKSVADYQGGKEKALGFLVGQTMKALKGQGNPGMVNEILKKLLS